MLINPFVHTSTFLAKRKTAQNFISTENQSCNYINFTFYVLHGIYPGLTEELLRFNSISIFLYETTLTLGFKLCKKANVKGRLAKVKKKNRNFIALQDTMSQGFFNAPPIIRSPLSSCKKQKTCTRILISAVFIMVGSVKDVSSKDKPQDKII